MRKNYKKASSQKFYALLAAAGIIAVGSSAIFFSGRISVYPLWLLSTSIVTFFLYGYDKMQSQNGGGRMPEVIFHVLTLIGGFPGAFAGRSVFRHKTLKPAFLAIIITATLIHAAAMTVY